MLLSERREEGESSRIGGNIKSYYLVSPGKKRKIGLNKIISRGKVYNLGTYFTGIRVLRRRRGGDFVRFLGGEE